MRGFTLIEVLVGLGSRLIGVVLMFRMAALWDMHSRSAIAGATPRCRARWMFTSSGI